MWNNPSLLNWLATLITSIALVLFCLGGVGWLMKRPMFNLKTIQVESHGRRLEHVNLATIRAAALPAILNGTPANFFTVDLEVVRQAFENVAWVRHAQVRRQWPNQLAVRIEEHQALAIWNDERFVNLQGELFAANLAEAEEEDELPRFSGPPGSEKQVVARYHDFINWFKPLNMTPDHIDLSARYAWSIHLDNGHEAGLSLELGRERSANSLAQQIERFIAAYPLVSARWPELQMVDLRYPNGFAINAPVLPKTRTPQKVSVSKKA